MKIRVVGQNWYRCNGWDGDSVPVYLLPDSAFWKDRNFISIRNSCDDDLNCAVPVNQSNVLKLQFDDAVEPEGDLVLFDESMARKIVEFINAADRSRELFINCSAGISRSGAVGEVLNDYFNRCLERNEADNEYFQFHNRQVLGNPLVRRILRNALFGIPFSGAGGARA